MKERLKNLKEWGSKKAHTKWGVWAIFICAFADASFLPLPTPMFFITLVLLNIPKAYKFALFGTLGSMFGAIAGYSIGYFAWLNANGEFSGLAQFVFHHVPGFSEAGYNNIQMLFVKWDFWILFIASLTPIPYKIFSISSGVFDINIFIFCITTLVSQGVKFYLLALLAIKIGPGIHKLLESKLKPIAIIVTACAALTIIVIKVF